MARESSIPSNTPSIELSGVRFRWPARQDVGFDIERFQVKRGERVLLLGPSGSGKSTLLSLVCGIVAPRGGRICVLGEDIASMGARARDRFRADHFGIVFQMFNLLPYASAIDNVMLPLSFSPGRRARASSHDGVRAESARLLRALGIDESHAARVNASKLSIGQQQRVAVARALIGGPEIVIADEPTSALDDDAQKRLLDLLFAQLDALGTTLLMVSHDQRLARQFDRAVHIDDVLSPLAEPVR